MKEETATSPAMQRYLPRVALEWELDAPDRPWQAIDATLVFVDISGFTRLSEKLARRGRIGAEVLTEVLSAVFGRMLALAYERGGGAPEVRGRCAAPDLPQRRPRGAGVLGGGGDARRPAGRVGAPFGSRPAGPEDVGRDPQRHGAPVPGG